VEVSCSRPSNGRWRSPARVRAVAGGCLLLASPPRPAEVPLASAPRPAEVPLAAMPRPAEPAVEVAPTTATGVEEDRSPVDETN
jgi:hypothetical protein